MLTDRLKAVMESASHLSPELQDRLAEEIASAMDNALWDAELDDPQSDDILEALVARARQQAPLPLPTPHDFGDEDEGEAQ
jgi:hypothetical protein